MTDLPRLELPADVSIAIIGTGFSGLGMAIQLLRSGFTNFQVFEAANEIGGTWRDNVYPGAACDIPSHLYSYSFAQNPNWSRSYAQQEEILNYMRDVVDRFGVGPYIRFEHLVERAQYNEEHATWTLTFSNGQIATTNIVISGCGALSQAKIPPFEGRDSFEQPMFHTSHWDRVFDWSGKRIGVVGTGASAIQVVPELVNTAAHVTVFQRTPPWIMPRPDREISSAEKQLFRKLDVARKAVRGALFLRQEAPVWAFTRSPKTMEWLQKLAERHIANSVADPEMRKELTPDFVFGCKRILVSSDYYPSLQKENAKLETSPIVRFTPDGIETEADSYALDAVVFATGFQASESVTPFDALGRAGHRLEDDWQADAMEAYKGTTVTGFPNLFLLVGPNTVLGHNSMIIMIEAQIDYVLSALRTFAIQSIRSMEVKPEKQRAYNDKLQAEMKHTVWLSGCRSWYLTESGKNTTLWPGSTMAFRKQTALFDVDAYTLEKR